MDLNGISEECFNCSPVRIAIVVVVAIAAVVARLSASHAPLTPRRLRETVVLFRIGLYCCRAVKRSNDALR